MWALSLPLPALPLSMQENKVYCNNFVRPGDVSNWSTYFPGAVNLAASKETVEMKDNMSYGPVRVQSQTATQEPVYEEPDAVQQPAHIHTGGNVAYGHIRPHC